MKRKLKRGIVAIIALLFLAVGVIGLFLPFLQGLLFIAVGIVLLSILSTRIQTKLEKLTIKYPRFHGIVVKIDTAVRRIVGEV